MDNKFYKIRITEWRDEDHEPRPELVRASEVHQAALNEWRKLLEEDHKAKISIVQPSESPNITEARALAITHAQHRIADLEREMKQHEDTHLAEIRAHPKVGTYGYQELSQGEDGTYHLIRLIDENGKPFTDSGVLGYEVISELLDKKGGA